jgi:hypothetical protein
MRRPSVEAVERALYDSRSVVRLHGFRRTMWVMTPRTAASMFSSTTAGHAEALTQRLVSLVEANEITSDAPAWVENAKAELLDALSERGTATTRELGEACPDTAIALEVQGVTVNAHSRLMACLGFDGAVVRTRPLGSWISSQYAWAPMDAWVEGGIADVSPEAGARTIVDAYLRGFGPATFKDIKWWTGWTAVMTRQALADAGAVPVEVDGGEAFVAANDVDDLQPEPWTSFLPGLDPTTMGWKERDWYLDPDQVPWLFDRNGNAGPTVWMDGRVVGGWAQATDGEIRHQLFDQEAVARSEEIDAAAERLAAFLGDTRPRPRFPTPALKDLS